jgi:hypothetical protein
MTIVAINAISGLTAGGLIVSSVLKAQDGRLMTAALRFGLGVWILTLAVEAMP